MRTKSLYEPMGILEKDDEWLSPDGHSPTWLRVWNGLGWDCKEGPVFPEPSIPVESSEEPSVDIDQIETDEIDGESDEQPGEDHDDEHGMQTAVPDSDGGKQGSSGNPESEPKQRRQRGKVRKGGKGK